MEDRQNDRSPFINTRCRLQRLKDAKFFAGWVRDLTKEELHLRLSTRTGLMMGDRFAVEVHGTDRSAIFTAALCSQDSEELVFRIHEQVRYLPSRERARLAVEGITGKFKYQGVDTPFSVSDVSLQGCGLVVPFQVPRGAKLTLDIDTPQGLINCSGEVRYCKQDADIPGAYRIGMLLDIMARLESARWTKLFEFYSAA